MKFCITLKLKSGAKFALSHKDGCVALVPFDGMAVHHASTFNTRAEAADYLSKQLDCAPQLRRLSPFVIEQGIEPHEGGQG